MASLATQHAAVAGTPLVFDGATVVDVDRGRLLPDQRVVIEGNHIRELGPSGAIKLPKDARVVDAHGKYLMPGLWDMHVHPGRATDAAYPSFIAYGVTGIRDAGSMVPLDTLLIWRRDILAGARIGPPRQLLSGQSIMGPLAGCNRSAEDQRLSLQTCIADSADARRYVDSLRAAGADMIKPREVDRAMYFVIAAEARRQHIPFGGHASYVTELEASDSGAVIVDHAWGDAGCTYDVHGDSTVNLPGLSPELLRSGGVRIVTDRGIEPGDPEVEACQKQAIERFRHNGTWFVPTFGPGLDTTADASLATLRLGVPLLAGTDKPASSQDWGPSLHQQLAIYVNAGLTPLAALQSATLNPAQMLHSTDSLGTVAPGKLADLVLLDANPLADIANTMAIRAVVANGRYFDRAALDHFLR